MNLLKILIGGCSSIGKTTAAELLSKHLGVTHCPLDKIRNSFGHPIFREFDSPEVWDNDIEDLVSIVRQMSIQLRPIIEKWCINTQSGLLEGEGIEPDMVSKLSYTNNLKVIYIIETDAERLHTTLYGKAKKYRDLSEERQKKVLAMNTEYSKFIQSEAVKFNQPWVYSEPWETLHHRILKTIS